VHEFDGSSNLGIENGPQPAFLTGFRPRSDVRAEALDEQHIGQPVDHQLRPGRRFAISDASMFRVVCSASVCAWSAFTSMSGGSRRARGFTLGGANLNHPEMMVVGAPPPPY